MLYIVEYEQYDRDAGVLWQHLENVYIGGGVAVRFCCPEALRLLLTFPGYTTTSPALSSIVLVALWQGSTITMIETKLVHLSMDFTSRPTMEKT